MIEDIVLSPLTSAILLLLLLLITWRKLPRWLRGVGMLLGLLLVVAMTPLGANLLVRTVESRAPRPSSCPKPHPDTIVVLGGGLERPADSATDFGAANAESLRRLFTGVALWRQTSGATLVVAGGDERGTAQSVVLAELARQLGVPAAAIRVERKSLTTWQNAHDLAAMLHDRRIWLVTSALHMPRALGAFRHFGLQACAWPSGSLYVAPDGIGYLIPQSSSLDKAGAALHEIVGGIAYQWRAGNAPKAGKQTHGR